MILENVNNNVGELVGLIQNPFAVPNQTDEQGSPLDLVKENEESTAGGEKGNGDDDANVIIEGHGDTADGFSRLRTQPNPLNDSVSRVESVKKPMRDKASLDAEVTSLGVLATCLSLPNGDSLTPVACLNRSMDSDKYLEGQSMQRPPLFESDHFIYWKIIFEPYVKAKDLDLWHIILNGDFPPVARNKETQVLEMVPFETQNDDLTKKLAKNNEAKMILYNALPKKEYERNFICKTAKDIWQSLLITLQGNSQVKDNKIDLLVQQYEQFTILEEEYIDSGFARFKTIITSLKALDEGFSSKNYVRKFLRTLHPKWRAKVTAIKEWKDFSSLALNELIGNLKVHEVVMEKDSKIYKGKKERVKSIALKAKKESGDDENTTSGSDDEEYAMAVRNFKNFFRRKGKFVRKPREGKKSFRQRDEKKGKSDRKCFRCGDQNHLIGDCPKPSRNKDQKAFIGGCLFLHALRS
ncbi:zf-CCHC domain-containing protein [Tanacetum coccineum]|uniref:Zf-CCHC domain-containing protein n=1 Tax=Tanacetum coccineum TaxID=301880 RepID=A0ABQ4ZPY9_9ASTR